MYTMKQKGLVYTALAAAALVACSQPGAPSKSGVRPDAATAVAAIRDAGAKFETSVEVHPLRDPAIDGLLQQAHGYEAQQQVGRALQAVGGALKIAPNAPDLLQYQAELLIESGDWKQAASVAQKSLEVGPKTGALCARNVQTLIETRRVLRDDAALAQARQQMASCKVPAPPRY